MKTSNSLWTKKLAGKIDMRLADEIDEFETTIDLRSQGKVDEKLFAETRLRRGVYGQRYDNGQRYDGKQTRKLEYEERHTKGPNTAWDAPGMQRIKIPYGGVTPEQLELMAELAEEYSDDIAHVTTRQDFQLHFVHVNDTPTIMRRLASVGITTQEACGNSVRNVTGCPFAGVCRDEIFDVTPYARAVSEFLLGHPDCQDFGRKFKPALSGCRQHSCGLTTMHDFGLEAAVRQNNGTEERGFRLLVGGGLGAVPHQAKLYDEFMKPEEVLPTAQAIARVFARLGEKKNRNRARIKFLITDLGMEEFKRLVEEERKILPPDPKWSELMQVAESTETPLKPGAELPDGALDNEDFRQWYDTNVRLQRQDGYAVATVNLPLGDITGDQLRDLADIVREFTNGTVRTTVEQNFVIRWVSKADLPALHAALNAVGLGDPGAGNIVDIVACPGTDTCKLGISSSRGLAAALRTTLAENFFNLDQAVKDLHIKISGCFNSCGQHHICDIGFYGVSRRVNGYKVPHFQVVLGGEWENNAASYGLPVAAVPSKSVPQAVELLTDRYVKDRQGDEKFKEFVKRIGKVEVKKILDGIGALPPYAEDSSFYVDWADPREYSTQDIGVGECAGEVVSLVDFELAAAERLSFEANVALDEGDPQKAGETAYRAMLRAAKGLIKIEYLDINDDPNKIVSEFRTRFYDTEKIFDPFAGGKFANYLFAAHDRQGEAYNAEKAHHTVEEAQLFIECAHSCYARLGPEVS